MAQKKKGAPELGNERYINLATFRRDGRAVETPVWAVGLNGKLYVFTDGPSAKVKRIRATKKVRVAPCGMAGHVTGEWVEGAARVVDDSALEQEVYTALDRKYGWQKWLLDLGSPQIRKEH